MDLSNFLQTVVTSSGGGWFCLAHAKIGSSEDSTNKSWKEEFYSWPDELPVIINRVNEIGKDYDIYFSPFLFSSQSSTKADAIPGRTIVADLDYANVLTLPLKPSVLVETSPGRHQGYWILRDELDRTEHESLSRRLTYSIPRCDRTGWFLGKKVRVPETYNHKYVTGPQYVRVVESTSKTFQNSQVEEIASSKELYGANVDKVLAVNEEDFEWAANALEQDIGPQEMLARIRSSVPTIVARYNLVVEDRSAALWNLYHSLFKAGLARDKVLYISYHSPNNKFKELRYGGIRELAKDVLRAEIASKIQLPDVKARIKDARNLSGNATERAEYIAKCVREHLDKLGSFIRCIDDSVWFVRSDTGRPINISTRNEQLIYLLDTVFGVNGSERESLYLCKHLAAMGSELPVTGRVANGTSYDHRSKTFRFHTGRKDILVVDRDNIKREINGEGGIIFPWSSSNSVVSPHYELLDKPWEDELFEDCFNNVLNIDPKHAKVILKTWLISVLLKDGLASRPILALIGSPGSGKSTFFRRVYTLLYGKERGLNTVSKEEDFDHAMAMNPLVVLDNVDTYARWLPDRMAATVSPTEIQKRKLFTDGDTYVLRRDAMLGITAHDPKNSRVDVTDRMLLFNFQRLTHFKPESPIYERIIQLRNGIWGAILRDIQTILSTEMPRSGYPQFRIEDFAQFGYWIATALGHAEEFTEGINTIMKSQKRFNLEEDMMLVDALDALLDREVIDEAPSGALFLKLRRLSKDERNFERKYGNAISLGRRLFILLDSLREEYDITWKTKKGIRVWSISRYEENLLDGTKARENGSGSLGAVSV